MSGYMLKPGIKQVWPQVKVGYRGEIETDDEMVNRISYDLFYIEKTGSFVGCKTYCPDRYTF